MAGFERITQLVGAAETINGAEVSRATSPGGDWEDSNGDANGKEKLSRCRPRTFPYTKYLPYETESDAERLENLNTCIKHLYVAVSAGDFSPGAVHWTREIRGWLALKFDLPRHLRVKLIKLYYELALAPGLDVVVAERFASMFMVLTKYVLRDSVCSGHVGRCGIANIRGLGANTTSAPARTSFSTGGLCTKSSRQTCCPPNP